MNNLRQRKYLFALLALFLLLGACKGESPTAPPITPPGGGAPPGTPPGAGSSVTLTVANPNPLTDSSTAITATVLVNGAPAPAGTAVEFETTLGRFEESGTNATLRTTNAQGQVTVRLTSASAGTATVTAVVNNIVQRATVVFTAAPAGPPPPAGTTITSLTPTFGPVDGGTIVTINGVNFREPVRVFFDLGGGDLREATVVSVTSTQIRVIAPRVQLSAGQSLDAPVVVFVEAGTPNEQRVTSPAPFSFRRAQLTPEVKALSPSSGPLEGGTRVTIFGEGFESFVQVFFGLAEAQIVNVTFDSIVVIAPNSRDTTASATPVAGPVPVRVVNVNSGTQSTFTEGFRYSSAMQIVAVSPTEGPFIGGTRVRIDGVGFDDPVAVTIGGVAAQVISVSGTQIIAITSGIRIEGCGEESGPISVTNINTGLSATSTISFIYRVLQPVILTVSDETPVGGAIVVRVLNAFGVSRLRLGDTNLTITGSVENPDGSTTFTAIVPLSTPLETEPCTGLTGISAPKTTTFDVTYESVTSGCTDTLTNGARITPVNAPIIAVSGAFIPFSSTTTAGNPGNPAATPPVPATNATATTPPLQQVTLANVGPVPLSVSSMTLTDGIGRGCSAFFITATPAPPTTLERCEGMVISAQYQPPTQTSPTPTTDSGSSCTVRVITDAGTRTFTVSGSTQ